jgi:hypothetical protein
MGLDLLEESALRVAHLALRWRGAFDLVVVLEGITPGGLGGLVKIPFTGLHDRQGLDATPSPRLHLGYEGLQIALIARAAAPEQQDQGPEREPWPPCEAISD